jgi:isopropylmalate/homocitrate/citramalate synthase
MKLLDLTLREGDQQPNRNYSVESKVAAAQELDSLSVDFIQIGFPVAGEKTTNVCADLAIDAQTTGIARALDQDIQAAAAAGVDVIDVFAPTSDHQRNHLLDQSRAELRETILVALDTAHDTGCEVHFTAMDGFRTDPTVLNRLLSEVGTEYFTLADTVGVRTPTGVYELLETLDADRSRIGVHFHDDLGLATANALAAADCGIGKVDVSVAGIGERAGNTSLEEFSIAGAVGDESVSTALDTTRLLPTIHRVVNILDEPISTTKSLLGDDVFAHESGLHTAAMLDDPATFEPFDPAQFGGERRLLFGSQSGSGAARRLLERANRKPKPETVAALVDALHALDQPVTLDEAIDLARRVDS